MKQQLLRSKDGNRYSSCRDSDVEFPVSAAQNGFVPPESKAEGDDYTETENLHKFLLKSSVYVVS